MQFKRFEEAARELGCSEDEEAFDKALKKVASAPPSEGAEKTKPKKIKLDSFGRYKQLYV